MQCNLANVIFPKNQHLLVLAELWWSISKAPGSCHNKTIIPGEILAFLKLRVCLFYNIFFNVFIRERA